METILFLSPTESGSPLSKSALEALATTKQLADSLGTTFSVGLWGDAPKADDIASCGADKFYAVTGAEFSQPRYATDAAAAEALCRAAGATIVVGPSGSRWNRIQAGVAHRLGGRADSHVTGLSVSDGSPAIARWYYRQRMEGILTRAQRPWVLAVESGIAPAWQGAPGTAAVEAVACTPPAARSNVTGIEALTADQQTIRPDADLLFVTGAGWTKKQPDGQVKTEEAQKLILAFLGLSRASLGSTKSLVDLSGEGQATLTFLTHMNQVGQTGSTPRHAKGLSTCCHGEEPHTVGWRFIGERRAISLDANCGWARGKADVLYVADAFAVMEKVNDLLAKKAGG
ncbi:MAG: electron transfer flavoprotein subunit alpha [Verrucomicrobia bacterium]|nr:electron transfer flavoprotein subunit alpha [Verrucomicrobiota bacterium]